ncbi:hypothetical protein Nepgr_024728 [Nepenthes gracilis]|uniref:Uncharacterized protein n=1 Tax=Nepenthes gracilis TaxID=150966 RepID=A0AAD3T4P3_NEPGR|nr:hypothetical protein Nepgr_024728 [Nepenthes gracilis]
MGRQHHQSSNCYGLHQNLPVGTTTMALAFIVPANIPHSGSPAFNNHGPAPGHSTTTRYRKEDADFTVGIILQCYLWSGSGAIPGSVVLIAALSLAGLSSGPGCLLKPSPYWPVGAEKDQSVMVCWGLLRLYCIARGPVWTWEYCVLQKAVLDLRCYSGWTPVNLPLAAYLQCSKLPAVLWVKLLGWH